MVKAALKEAPRGGPPAGAEWSRTTVATQRQLDPETYFELEGQETLTQGLAHTPRATFYRRNSREFILRRPDLFRRLA